MFLFLILLFLGGVFADSWDDFEDGSDENADYESDENSDTTEIDNDVLDNKIEKTGNGNSQGETRFTEDFYIAVTISIVGFAVLILLIYLFMKRPENKWERKGKNESFE